MTTDPASQGIATRVRFVIVLVTTLMAVLLYLDRFCVSIAAEYIREDLGLKQADMAWFLAAFFWSYALSQVPSGWCSDRYGARIMLTVYILSWSFFTGMVGAVTTLAMLIVMRLGCGLGQAGAYPTSAGLLSNWVPFANRGLASATVALGGRTGGVLAPILTAWLMVVFVPQSTSPELTAAQILDGRSLAQKIAPTTRAEGEPQQTASGAHIWERLSPDGRELVRDLAETANDEQPVLATETREQLAEELNALMGSAAFYDPAAFAKANLAREAWSIKSRIAEGETLSSREQKRFHRLVLEGAFRNEIGKLYVKGWRPVMYVYGAVGIVVALVFWIVFRDRPAQHPWVNRAEAELIAGGAVTTEPSERRAHDAFPAVPLLTSVSMWANCIMQFTTNVGWLFLITWLPRYLADVHQVPILEQGVMTAVPIFVGIFGMFSGGALTDLLVPRVGLKWGRRLPMMATRFSAALGYAICLGLSTLDPATAPSWLPWGFVGALSLVALSTDMGSPSVWAFSQDVGGRYVASILGWGNMWGNLGAAVAPLIYNHFLGETPSIVEWNTMFGVCMGAFVLSGLCALLIDATQKIQYVDPERD